MGECKLLDATVSKIRVLEAKGLDEQFPEVARLLAEALDFQLWSPRFESFDAMAEYLGMAPWVARALARAPRAFPLDTMRRLGFWKVVRGAHALAA